MADSTLGILSKSISSQFSLGENDTTSLDSVIDGKTKKYGTLGDYAARIDQSAQRSYVEEGFFRSDPYTIDQKRLEILFQEPDATVLIKKRMFSSVAENFRPDFMNEDERLYFKAVKTLFQNKCRQISCLEKLTKIQKITSAVGNINEQFVPILTSISDIIVNDSTSDPLNPTLSNGNPFLQNKDVSAFVKVADKLKSLYAYNQTNPYTTWITDSTNLFKTNFGEGTGVIEITNFSSLRTNITNSLNSAGNFNLNISDPYKSMYISEYDIEKAIADSTNNTQNRNVYQLRARAIEDVVNSTQNKLNSLRSFRRASPISFKINPDTLLSRKVIAIVDRTGNELKFEYKSSGSSLPGLGGFTDDNVVVSSEYILNVSNANGDKGRSLILGKDGLDSHAVGVINSELDLFKALVGAIFTKIQLQTNSMNAFQQNNDNTNYTRRKMRASFNGKLIIQPMDVIHIYVSSKSRYDKKLMTGINNLMAGNGILQNMNKTISDLGNAVSLLNTSNVSSQVEKNVYVGQNFPNFIWAMMRSQFVTEKEGCHIFAGIVQSAELNQDGFNKVTVSGSDNSYYFEQGKINFKPGSDVSNGTFYDPLTPFETKFDKLTTNIKDDAPVLLKENQFLISSKLIKSKLGPNAGSTVTINNYIQDKSFDPNSKLLTRTFYAPDGLVYKWKEGIGAFVQFGSSLSINDSSKVGNPNLYQDPFAGQDVMNTISLLICGQPYNFAKFWQTTAQPTSFGKDSQTNQQANHSYMSTLSQELSKKNSLWGNFIPFKSLVVDEASYSKVLQGQTRILQANLDLENKIQKFNDLNKKFIVTAGGARNIDLQDQAALGNSNESSQANELSKEINSLIDSIRSEDDKFTSAIENDVVFNSNSTTDSGININNTFSASGRRSIRRQINHLTRKMSYSIRANNDRNYFIVDDSYDKDYDIAAYNSDLDNGLKLYNNDFSSVKEKIINAASVLNLEVFFDSQGNIRARAPQYNRMPSSVFQKMMYFKRAHKIQYFPEFMNDLFGDQIDTLRVAIEVLEDKIRLDCATLGYANDKEALNFILHYNPSSNSKKIGDPFSFISDENGYISDVKGLINSANPDIIDKNTNLSLNQITDIVKGQAKSTKSIYTNPSRYYSILDLLSRQNLARDGKNTSGSVSQLKTNKQKIDDIAKRIFTKTAERVSTSYNSDQISNDSSVRQPAYSTVDVFKVTKDISDKIKERQKAVKYFYNSIKNAREYRYLDDDKSSGNNLLNAGAFSKEIPEVFESMIEDESYDDLGLDSGKRYVIRSSQIKNLRYSEKPPEYTSVEVSGTLNNYSSKDTPEDLRTFPGGGNAMTTAIAIDYDMWRNYGFKNGSPITVPFLSNPESQCAPYAAMLLSRARKNILKGTVTIAGNEFMQQGEVVYIEEVNLLFYITSVQHSFTYGQSFETTLEIEYGHSPGEYIPTTLDFIGKMIYNNRDIASHNIQRQSNSNNEANLGIIIRDPNSENAINASGKSKVNSYSSFNEDSIRNIIYTAASKTHQNFAVGSKVAAYVELRIYNDSKNVIDPSLKEFANSIRSLLTDKVGKTKQSFGTSGNNSEFNDAGLPPESVLDIQEVDMDNVNDKRSPSQKAISMSRNLSFASSPPVIFQQNSPDLAERWKGALGDFKTPNDADKIRSNLFSYVVDCWISFKEI